MIRRTILVGALVLPPVLLAAEAVWRRATRARPRTGEVYSNAPARGRLPWAALAPFLCIAFVAAPVLALSDTLEKLGLADAKGDPIGLAGLFVFLVPPFLLSGLLVLAWVRWVERRPLATIGLPRAGAPGAFARGLGIGIATASLLVAAIGAAGGYVVSGWAPALASPRALLVIAGLLAAFIVQSGVEELVFRGWLMSVVARRVDVGTAVVVTSLVFTFLHYSPHQPWRIVAVSFLFSTFACCWALRAGEIWSVMGWHAAWNWLIGTGFELPITHFVTGAPALCVRLVPRGPEFLTGGSEGPEGSVLASGFFVVAIAVVLARRRVHRARG